jgi:hypothetical protein
MNSAPAFWYLGVLVAFAAGWSCAVVYGSVSMQSFAAFP